jgi:predicted lipoprotein with Yx(FWY)xxD motif
MKTRRILGLAGVLSAGAFMIVPALSSFAAETITRAVIPAEREEALKVPMPSVFHVEYTELDGPVFADAAGRTLYFWPNTTMRNGVTGDPKNQSMCTETVQTHTAGLMSPYPPGLELPELKTRKSCLDMWPAVYAADDAKPAGAFTVITRKDGKKQWAYDQHALYTSDQDKVPGDVNGASTRGGQGDGPAARDVAQAPSAIPPGFLVRSSASGRMLLTDKNFSIYMWDRDGANKSVCDEACTRTWVPVVASVAAQPQGDWSIFERSPGVRQWAFRKKPLYTYALDAETRSQEGSDVPGWHNVYVQKAPALPRAFTQQDTETGVTLADAKGKTVYTYNCADDSVDQLSCKSVDSPQVYRLAICGGGKVERCLHDWPYVMASKDDKTMSRTWSVMEIDPQTGHLAQPGKGLRVWAYQGLPVYTYAGDKVAGDMNGNGNGEFGGSRNGFRAFVMRDDFFGGR